MPPFRPANLNKRAYPGNASVIGPTCTATVGFTTTSCCSSTASCAACSEQNVLGCRCTFCACPCCNVCCSCPQTLCDRTVPSGRWKASEQYEARTRDAWGDDTCSCGGATCLCSTNIGIACTGVAGVNDCQGFFICCGPSTCKWFVAPSCTQITTNWRGGSGCTDAINCANSLMGSCGWFVPSCGQMQNPGYCCRTYWDTYNSSSYWTTSDTFGNPPFFKDTISMVNGACTNTITVAAPYSGSCSYCRFRTFRTVA